MPSGTLDLEEIFPDLNSLRILSFGIFPYQTPAGESFSKPKEFVDMLRQYRGKYEMKKTFSNGDDVCLLYDLATQGKKVYMSSWYHASGGKIDFIRTIFDPSQFSSPKNFDLKGTS